MSILCTICGYNRAHCADQAAHAEAERAEAEAKEARREMVVRIRASRARLALATERREARPLRARTALGALGVVAIG